MKGRQNAQANTTHVLLVEPTGLVNMPPKSEKAGGGGGGRAERTNSCLEGEIAKIV